MALSLSDYIQTVKRFKPSEIEDSALLRILIFLTVSIGIVATVHVSESPFYIAIIGIGLSGMGSWISWKRRRLKNWWIKLILALLMLLALANFLVEISQNPYDARIPLSTLLIWLQVLHSFDLPRRKDLFYSLWVALILISVGATISRDIFFGIYLLLFMACGTLSLMYTHLSEYQIHQVPTSFLRPMGIPVLAFTILGTFLAFPLLPRYEGMKIRTLPMSFKIQALPGFTGEIKNPAYPSRGANSNNRKNPTSKQKRKFDPFSYYGFSTNLDLNYRGILSEEIVMRVKSTKASYWRGMAFDKYTGLTWEMTHPYRLNRLSGNRPPIYVRETTRLKKNITPREEVIQTFYIEKDQSNLVFAAPYVEFLYFPTDYVLLDFYGGLRSPIELFHGTVYSVVSAVPVFDGHNLRKAPSHSKLDPINPLYLQVPSTITPRVRELAKKIVTNTTNPFDGMKAIENHLRESYPYNLSIPEFPEDRDAIDYFLFEQKAGYCEHFASSLAIMARVLGMPSRLVTGYTAGEYNPITGYFEVRSKNAHAWVEIYFPHHGWVPFDPTPGFNAYLGHHNIYKENTNKQFFEFILNALPQTWRNVISQSFQFLVGLFVSLLTTLSQLVNAFSNQEILGVISIGIVFILWFAWRNWRREKWAKLNTAEKEPAFIKDPDKKQFVESYQKILTDLCQTFAVNILPSQTPIDKVKSILTAHQDGLSQPLLELTHLYYQIRYSSSPFPQEKKEEIATMEKIIRENQDIISVSKKSSTV